MKLKDLIVGYVAFRKALGEDFTAAEGILRAFCRQMGEESDVTDIAAERVLAFLAGTGGVTRYWHRKYTVLNGLYRFALSRGLVTSSPLPSTLPRPPERMVPFIYTHDQLRTLFSSTTAYRKEHRKLEPHTLRAILLVLYGAGLRISEAVGLTLADVDLAQSVLTIHDTKFHKTRLVPLGAELTQVLAQYAEARKKAGHVQSPEALVSLA